MPSFRTEVPHQLGQDTATERLKEFLEKIRERYQDQVSQLAGEWQGSVLTFSLTTYGITVKGTLTVEDQRARLEGTLPLAAMPFRGKIQDSIASELERELA
jgi:hypothetical protein